MARFKVIAFDVDGTLYSNRKMYAQSFLWALKNIRLLYYYNKVRKELRVIRPIQNFYKTQSELMAKALNIPVDKAFHLIKKEFYHTWQSKLHKTPLLPGLRELINELKSKKRKLALASDFPVDKKLEILDIAEPWDLAFSTEELGYLKPNPEAFEHICNTFSAKPEEVLYVGNSYRYDVIGAKNYGCAAAHLTQKVEKDSIADFSFSHYNQLRDWLRKVDP